MASLAATDVRLLAVDADALDALGAAARLSAGLVGGSVAGMCAIDIALGPITEGNDEDDELGLSDPREGF